MVEAHITSSLRLWASLIGLGALTRPVLTHARYRRWFPRAVSIEALNADGRVPASVAAAFLRKRRIDEVAPTLLGALAREFGVHGESARHAVLTRAARGQAHGRFFSDRILPYRDYVEGGADAPAPLYRGDGDPARSAGAPRAVIVTTYNRPDALARSLPQIAALGVPVLVVDDGSSPASRAENARHAVAAGAGYLAIPENRGVAAALNAGLSYWLADPAVQWISCFQDDVDVDPDTLNVLARFEDAETQPLLSGFGVSGTDEAREEMRDGRRVAFKRFAGGVHLHGHRLYWSRVMPIPTRVLGAPSRERGTAGEDTWISHDAPAALGRRGQLILSVAGLVRHFAGHPADSTWGSDFVFGSVPRPPAKPDPEDGG